MHVSIDATVIVNVATVLVMAALAAFTAAVIITQSRRNRVLEKVTESIRKMLSDEHTANRLYEEEQLQRLEGNREKKKLLYRIDEMLVQSGIRKFLPIMTTELFLTILMIVSASTLYIVLTITGEFIFAIIAVIIVIMALYACIKMLIFRKQSKLEDEILQFANMIENYSRTTDDITSILGNVAPYLEEPLRTSVSECYVEIKATGDTQSAFARLDAKVGHRKFSELMQNIEICSRHETNYETVIKGNKEIIKNYLAEKAIRKQMANNARIKIACLLGLSWFATSQINNMLEGRLMTYLLSGLIGRAILCYCCGVVLYSIWKCITMGQEE